MQENRIPNPVSSNELHCTVVCSEVSIPGYVPDNTPVMVNPASYKINILNNVLVVEFKSDPVVVQWQRAMNMGGRSKWPRFIPHVSISYNMGEWFDPTELKPPPSFLVLDQEQCRPMIDGWAAINSVQEETEEVPSIYIPQNHLNVPREEMPQISEADKLAFIDWLEAQGIFVQFMDVQVALLRSVQSEINLKKVETLSTREPHPALNKPVIISKDNYILDGHHRWLAILNRDPYRAIEAYRVNLPIGDLLDVTRRFKKSRYVQANAA